MRTYIFRDIHGNRIEQKANSLVEAIRHSGDQVVGLADEKGAPQHCGGDCGDCNEVRTCAAREQAGL